MQGPGELEQLKRENAKRLKVLGEEIKEGYYVALDAYFELSYSIIMYGCSHVSWAYMHHGYTCLKN